MTQAEILAIVRDILARKNNARRVYEDVHKVKDKLIPLVLEGEISECDFYSVSSFLTPQSRSPLWERYFIEKHQCTRVVATKDSGDFQKNGVFYEYKSSGYNRDNALHIVQVRLWQSCNYVIQSISDDVVRTFILTHDEMRREVKLCKATSAHGTRSANISNENIELRFTVRKQTDDWQRWCDSYEKNFENVQTNPISNTES